MVVGAPSVKTEVAKQNEVAQIEEHKEEKIAKKEEEEREEMDT
jgi:hypothetical protein